MFCRATLPVLRLARCPYSPAYGLMLASSFTNTGSHSSDRCNMGPIARTTCSNVISGFFPPKLRRFGRQNIHAYPRTKPVTNQALIGSHLERAKPASLLGSFKPHFHVPSCKCDSQHLLQSRVFQCVADKVFDFAGLGVASKDQPVRPIRGTRPIVGVLRHQINPRRFDFPYARAAGGVLDVNAPPGLPVKHPAEATEIVDPLRGMRGLRTAVGRLGRPRSATLYETRRLPGYELLCVVRVR